MSSSVEKATASIRSAVSHLVGLLGDEDMAVVEKTAEIDRDRPVRHRPPGYHPAKSNLAVASRTNHRGTSGNWPAPPRPSPSGRRSCSYRRNQERAPS